MPQTAYKNLGLNPNWPRACRKFRTKDSGFKPSNKPCPSAFCFLLFVRRHSFSLYLPLFSHRVFAQKRFLMRSAIVLFIGQCAMSANVAIVLHVRHVSHVGQFLFQPHATASRLRGCVGVTWTSIRGCAIT